MAIRPGTKPPWLSRGATVAALALMQALPVQAGAASSPVAVSTEAAFDHAVTADLGTNGQPDPSTALFWYQFAATAELPAGQFNAAVMYDSGRGTQRDIARAAMWYAAAAAHGNARAALDLGQLYASGEGVPRNPQAARAWFEIATSRGLTAAARARLEPAGDPEVVEGNALAPDRPMRPVNISVVPVGHDVALVWAAPAQPRGLLPTRTYVELVARKNGGQQTIFAGYATATATAVTLPPGRFEYAWRTLTVSPSAATYVTSAWVHFIASVRPTPPSGRPG